MSLFGFYLNDVSPNCSEWEKILDHYGDYVSEEDVWEIASQYDSVPNFANIYQELLFNRLICNLCVDLNIDEDSEFLDIQCETNSRVSFFSVNAYPIYCYDDWFKVRNIIKKQIGNI